MREVSLECLKATFRRYTIREDGVVKDGRGNIVEVDSNGLVELIPTNGRIIQEPPYLLKALAFLLRDPGQTCLVFSDGDEENTSLDNLYWDYPQFKGEWKRTQQKVPVKRKPLHCVDAGGYFAQENGVITDHRGMALIVYKDGTVRLKTDYNGIQRMPAHRLVAMCFVPNPNNWNVVKFRDGDSTNRAAENLYWASTKNSRGTKQDYGHKQQVILELYHKGMTVSQIVESSECSKPYVYKTLRKYNLVT